MYYDRCSTCERVSALRQGDLATDAVQVKLYFMIGLPGELDEDVLGIVDTVRWLQAECRNDRWFMAVHVTISNFTPKPHTPFQCDAPPVCRRYVAERPDGL